MFPLGSVLFPYAQMPLQVFEPRYRVLVDDMVTGRVAPEFGVVLIERGHEVGGGETRFTFGTIARVEDVSVLPDGRALLTAVGSDRIRVDEWLEEDPYPRARVGRVFDADAAPVAPEVRTATLRDLRRVLGLAVELGVPLRVVEPVLDERDDVASFQAAAAAPIGPLDALALLELRSPAERFAQLGRLLDEQGELLAARLAAPEPPPEVG